MVNHRNLIEIFNNIKQINKFGKQQRLNVELNQGVYVNNKIKYLNKIIMLQK